jgi:WD40 repeat protein
MNIVFGFRPSVVIACLLIFVALPEAKAAESRNILWSVDWSADGKSFAIGGAWVGIFDAETHLKRRTPALDSVKTIAKVRWHPHRNLLALSGSADGITAIYDPATDQKIILKTKEGTRGIAWDASGERLATAGNRGELQIWDATGQLLHTTRPENAKSLTGVAWHPTGEKIVTISEFIRLYDGKGNLSRQFRHRPEAKGFCLLLGVEWHPSGEFFAVGDYGNHNTGDLPVIQFWSVDGKLLKIITVNPDIEAPFRNISWNREGTLLASASDALRIWSKDGELRHVGKSPDLLWGVRWNREGNRLLTSSHEGRVTLWTATAEVSRRIVEAPAQESKVAKP